MNGTLAAKPVAQQKESTVQLIRKQNGLLSAAISPFWERLMHTGKLLEQSQRELYDSSTMKAAVEKLPEIERNIIFLREEAQALDVIYAQTVKSVRTLEKRNSVHQWIDSFAWAAIGMTISDLLSSKASITTGIGILAYFSARLAFVIGKRKQDKQESMQEHEPIDWKPVWKKLPEIKDAKLPDLPKLVRNAYAALKVNE